MRAENASKTTTRDKSGEGRGGGGKKGEMFAERVNTNEITHVARSHAHYS